MTAYKYNITGDSNCANSYYLNINNVVVNDSKIVVKEFNKHLSIVNEVVENQ